MSTKKHKKDINQVTEVLLFTTEAVFTDAIDLELPDLEIVICSFSYLLRERTLMALFKSFFIKLTMELRLICPIKGLSEL